MSFAAAHDEMLGLAGLGSGSRGIARGVCGGSSVAAARAMLAGVRRRERPMVIDKTKLVERLHALGRHEDAIRVDEEMDQRLDLAKDAALIEQLGIVPSDLLHEAAGGWPPEAR
jgi:hypothetical protein